VNSGWQHETTAPTDWEQWLGHHTPALLLFARQQARCEADAGVPRKYSGLGVGLAIVRHLVELHRGRVRAESAGEGRGSTFSVEVPIS